VRKKANKKKSRRVHRNAQSINEEVKNRSRELKSVFVWKCFDENNRKKRKRKEDLRIDEWRAQ
jgi:hypothetical protein